MDYSANPEKVEEFLKAPNEYLLTVLSPFNHIGCYPDLDMTTFVHKSVRQTYNETVPLSLGGLLVWTPRNPGFELNHYAYVPGTGYVWYQNIPVDEDLSQNFDQARLVSAGLGVNSSTISGGIFALSGVINAVATQQMPDIRSLNFSTIGSHCRNDVDMELSVPVANGVTNLAYPSGQNRYLHLNPDLLHTVIHDESMVLTGIVWDTVGSYTMNLPVPPNLWGGYQVRANLIVTSLGPVPLVTVTVSYYQYDNGTNTAVLIADTRIIQGVEGQGGAWVFPVLEGFGYQAPAETIVLQILNGTVNTQKTPVFLDVPNYYLSNRTEDAVLIAYSGLTSEQSITIEGVYNYEAVPNVDLAKQIPTSYRDTAASSLNLEIAQQAVINRDMLGFKFVMPKDEYRRWLETGRAELATETGRLMRGSGFYDVLSTIFKESYPVISKLLASFQPEAGQAVDKIGKVVEGLMDDYEERREKKRSLQKSRYGDSNYEGGNIRTVKSKTPKRLESTFSNKAKTVGTPQYLRGSSFGQYIRDEYEDYDIEEYYYCHGALLDEEYRKRVESMVVATKMSDDRYPGDERLVDVSDIFNKEKRDPTKLEWWGLGGLLHAPTFDEMSRKGNYTNTQILNTVMGVGLNDSGEKQYILFCVSTIPIVEFYTNYTIQIAGEQYSVSIAGKHTLDFVNSVGLALMWGCALAELYITPTTAYLDNVILTDYSYGLALAVAISGNRSACIYTGGVDIDGSLVTPAEVPLKIEGTRMPFVIPYDEDSPEMSELGGYSWITVRESRVGHNVTMDETVPEIIWIDSLTAAINAGRNSIAWTSKKSLEIVQQLGETGLMTKSGTKAKSSKVYTTDGNQYYTEDLRDYDWDALKHQLDSLYYIDMLDLKAVGKALAEGNYKSLAEMRDNAQKMIAKGSRMFTPTLNREVTPQEIIERGLPSFTKFLNTLTPENRQKRVDEWNEGYYVNFVGPYVGIINQEKQQGGGKKIDKKRITGMLNTMRMKKQSESTTSSESTLLAKASKFKSTGPTIQQRLAAKKKEREEATKTKDVMFPALSSSYKTVEASETSTNAQSSETNEPEIAESVEDLQNEIVGNLTKLGNKGRNVQSEGARQKKPKYNFEESSAPSKPPPTPAEREARKQEIRGGKQQQEQLKKKKTKKQGEVKQGAIVPATSSESSMATLGMDAQEFRNMFTTLMSTVQATSQNVTNLTSSVGGLSERMSQMEAQVAKNAQDNADLLAVIEELEGGDVQVEEEVTSEFEY